MAHIRFKNSIKQTSSSVDMYFDYSRLQTTFSLSRKRQNLPNVSVTCVDRNLMHKPREPRIATSKKKKHTVVDPPQKKRTLLIIIVVVVIIILVIRRNRETITITRHACTRSVSNFRQPFVVNYAMICA